MMKIFVLLAAFVAFSSAKPALLSAPLIAAPPVVTASSSQYYHRFNNGLAAAYVAAPAAYIAPEPYIGASYAANYVSSPYFAGAAPYFAGAAPYIAI